MYIYITLTHTHILAFSPTSHGSHTHTHALTARAPLAFRSPTSRIHLRNQPDYWTSFVEEP